MAQVVPPIWAAFKVVRDPSGEERLLPTISSRTVLPKRGKILKYNDKNNVKSGRVINRSKRAFSPGASGQKNHLPSHRPPIHDQPVKVGSCGEPHTGLVAAVPIFCPLAG